MAASACLTEDELLGLATGALAEAPAAEAHLATCATCSALLAGAVRGDRTRAWDALAGTTLGPYRLDAQLGSGGMGAVYRAWDPRLGRAIAVKVLHGDGAQHAERLAAEARAAAAIDHRAIVGIHDVGVADGMPYVAMALVDGESLRSVLAAGGLGVARARALVLELLDGLAAAHARGVVHRDLKPENLVVTRDGLRILDFGLARFADASAVDTTASSSVQGTAGYMAPEQARGEPADARADLFAVGAIAYELVTGRRAFGGATQAERLSATLRDTPPLDELGDLAPIVLRCLAKEPRDRFQSAADLAWALRTTTAPAPPPAAAQPSRRNIVVGTAAALGLGGVGYALGRRGRTAPPAEPALRLLTHRTGQVYRARFTHDGGRVVYGAAWDAEPVAIHVTDLASGETSLLELPSADVLAVSARGELAASVGHRFVDHQSARGQLAIVPLAGGVRRPLADDVQDADFMPDPSTPGAAPVGAFAVVRANPSGFRVELPLGTTLAEEPGWITHVRVSPDGSQVAYLRHPQVNDDAGGLMLVDVATRAKRLVTGRWASISGLAWDPRGDALWFTASSNSLRTTLRRTTLDGRVTALRSRATARVQIHDISADRRGLVTHETWRLRAMAGDHDRSLSDTSYVSDLSADGTQLVVGELGHLEAGVGAYLVPFAGGRPLRLGSGFPVAISPSGLRIAANVSEDDRLVVYSTGSGDAPPIAAPGFVTVARWIDERALIALYDDRIWRLSLDHPPVALTATGGPLALDPARRRCAYVDAAHTLQVLDLATATTRALPGEFVQAEVCGWLAAPDAIVIRTTTTPILLDRIDPITGARSRHRQVDPPAMGLRAVDCFVLHPDGERFAYSYGQKLSELFVMTPIG